MPDPTIPWVRKPPYQRKEKVPKINVTQTREIDLPENAFNVGEVWFVPRDADTSKKSAKVARIVEAIRDATDENGRNVPVEFARVAKESGENYPQDVQASVQALEVLGMVEAYRAIDPSTGNPRASVFYRWVDPKVEESSDDESPDES